MKHRISLVITLPFLAACSTAPSTEDVLRSHGYSKSYVSGYHDGCPSGQHSAGEVFTKRAQDAAAYAQGGDYKTGWDYGFMTCRQQQIKDIETALVVGVAAGVAGSAIGGVDGVHAGDALAGVNTSAIQAAGW